MLDWIQVGGGPSKSTVGPTLVDPCPSGAPWSKRARGRGHGFTSVGPTPPLWIQSSHTWALSPIKMYVSNWNCLNNDWCLDSVPSRVWTVPSLCSWKFLPRRAVGFDRARGAIESNCPSGSKSSRIFQNIHGHRDGTGLTLDGTEYNIYIVHRVRNRLTNKPCTHQSRKFTGKPKKVWSEPVISAWLRRFYIVSNIPRSIYAA